MNQTKVAVITGATKGIGRETARQLAHQDYQVVITGRHLEAAQNTANEIEGNYPALAHALDVSSDKSVAAFFDWLWKTLGRIDILVNNAGRAYSGFDGTVEITQADELVEAFNNNAVSAYRMTKVALPAMNKQRYGRIVNVSSGGGGLTEMGPSIVSYRISKTAMNAITRITSHEGQGDVKVNSVCPGWVRTDMGGPDGLRDVAEGAAGVIWAATLPADGPNGGFFRDGKPLKW